MPVQLRPLDEMATWRTLDQAAKQLGVSRRTLTRWIGQGLIQTYARMNDRHKYVDLDEIRRAMKEYRPSPPKAPEGK